MLLSHNTLYVSVRASPVESESRSQQALEALCPVVGLLPRQPLNHRIAQGWLLHVTNRDHNFNLLACRSKEPFLVLEKEVR